MKIKALRLVNFRNYQKIVFPINPSSTLIIGSNGSGKTNLLEAVFLLATGKSFKAETNQQLINWQEKFSIVEARLDSEQKIGIKIVIGPEQKTAKKTFLLDDSQKTRKLWLENFWAIGFRPEDIRILSGSPSRRRDFLDNILSQTDWQYQKNLSVYQKALRHRNKLLEKIYSRKAKVQELFYWDKALVKNGQYVSEQRRLLINQFNQFFKSHPNKEISSLFANYLANIINEKLLFAKKDNDIRQGHTSIGPHKDDFSLESSFFETEDKNIGYWGSRAQQRMAVLGLKLAELDFIEKKIDKKAVLLLDDIFSELDQNHQKLLTKIINNHQTIITATEKPTNLGWEPKQIIDLAKN
jgi:DNA replication and repair protein RecF